MAAVWLGTAAGYGGELNPADTAGCFTTVANTLLRSTFSFGVTNIPVYVNGQMVYTPAVNRLLQLAANVYDAGNTNPLPTVFRPMFSCVSGNIYITGYTQVVSVTGLADPQLAAPVVPANYATWGGQNQAVNLFGVPWILGAKKGLPNFNQLAMVNAAQVTRRLLVSRNTTNITANTYYWTNQMYVMSITNSVSISFWNPYESAYPRPLTVYASDWLMMTLTNSVQSWFTATNFVLGPLVINSWPGSQWSASFPPPNATPQPSSFVAADWSLATLPAAVYRFATASFDPLGSPTSANWETTDPPLPPLPTFGLQTTNYLQAVILDGTNIVDYVQLIGPASSRNLNQELTDPNYPSSLNIRYQWSTNTLNGSFTPWGVLNQLAVSGNPNLAPGGNLWIRPPTLPSNLGSTPAEEAAFFGGFFTPFWFDPIKGKVFVNSSTNCLAPYVPTRTLYEFTLWQANDPLVHYLTSDLTTIEPGVVGLFRTDYAGSLPNPAQYDYSLGDRYQPWGQIQQMARTAFADTNAYDLSFKDPSVWGADYWNFPTNLFADPTSLGQVHRGTPWQTLYLKSADILKIPDLNNFPGTGTNTWMIWTADTNVTDAARMAPVNDWRLAGLLAALLDTNSPSNLASVNRPNLNDWLNLCNGLMASSNSAPDYALWNLTTQFDTHDMTSNSPQAAIIANGVLSAMTTQPKQSFDSPGDILSAPELSVNSPWLNASTAAQIRYGIPDWVYEQIPAQLLLRLRADSLGVIAPANGGVNLQFTGADAFTYIVQASTDLVNWQNVSTNQPVQGSFNYTPTVDTAAKFFRTILAQ